MTKTAVAADDGDETRREEALRQIRDLLGQLGDIPPEDELRAEVAALRAEIRTLREQPPVHACYGHHCCGHVHYWPYTYTMGTAAYTPLTATSAVGSYSVSNVAAGGATTMTYQIDV
jgi:hypothetical protein